jgi:hypothetical protein
MAVSRAIDPSSEVHTSFGVTGCVADGMVKAAESSDYSKKGCRRSIVNRNGNGNGLTLILSALSDVVVGGVAVLTVVSARMCLSSPNSGAYMVCSQRGNSCRGSHKEPCPACSIPRLTRRLVLVCLESTHGTFLPC